MRRRLYCHSMKYIAIFELCSQAPEIHCALKIQDGAIGYFGRYCTTEISLYIGVNCSFWLTSVDTYFSFSCKLLTDKNSKLSVKMDTVMLRSHEHVGKRSRIWNFTCFQVMVNIKDDTKGESERH